VGELGSRSESGSSGEKSAVPAEVRLKERDCSDMSSFIGRRVIGGYPGQVIKFGTGYYRFRGTMRVET
jgi:hypothetical protein